MRPGQPAAPPARGTVGAPRRNASCCDSNGSEQAGRLPRGRRQRGSLALQSKRHDLQLALLAHPAFARLSRTDRFRLLVAAVRYTNADGGFWPRKRTWAVDTGDLPESASATEVASAERAYGRTIRNAKEAGLLEAEPHGRAIPGEGVRQTSNTYRWEPALVEELRGGRDGEQQTPSHQDMGVMAGASQRDTDVLVAGQDTDVLLAGQDTSVPAGTGSSEREELNGRTTNRGAPAVADARADGLTDTCRACEEEFLCADCATKYRSPRPQNEQQRVADEAGVPA